MNSFFRVIVGAVQLSLGRQVVDVAAFAGAADDPGDGAPCRMAVAELADADEHHRPFVAQAKDLAQLFEENDGRYSRVPACRSGRSS